MDCVPCELLVTLAGELVGNRLTAPLLLTLHPLGLAERSFFCFLNKNPLKDGVSSRAAHCRWVAPAAGIVMAKQSLATFYWRAATSCKSSECTGTTVPHFAVTGAGDPHQTASQSPAAVLGAVAVSCSITVIPSSTRLAAAVHGSSAGCGAALQDALSPKAG